MGHPGRGAKKAFCYLLLSFLKQEILAKLRCLQGDTFELVVEQERACD